MLKMLVGTACVAVIAMAGYFFWGEWQARQAAIEEKASLYRFLGAEPGDAIKAEQNCEKTQYDLGNAVNLGWDADAIDHAQKMVAACEANGFL